MEPAIPGKNQQRVFVCGDSLSDPKYGYQRCKTEGVMVWSNGDGWGGGCENEYVELTTNDGQKVNACFSTMGFSGIGLSNNGDRFLIEGVLSEHFQQTDVKKVIESFSFQ